MARSIEDIHLFIEDIERKERGAYHAPGEIDAALDASQKELFRECYEIKDWNGLDPFKVTNASFTSTPNGLFSFDVGCECFRSAFSGTILKPIPIRIVDEDELPDAINSQLRKISATKPIAVRSTSSGIKGISIFPPTTYNGFYTYYKTPSTPKMAYAQVGRVVTYNSSQSVQLQFSDIYVDRVISKALGFLGISMSEDEIVNFSQYKEKTA